MNFFHTAIAATLLGLGTLPAHAYEPIISLPGEHRLIHPSGVTDEVLATREQTDGEFGMIILSGPAGSGPGPSITHHRGSETWYVLEGTFEFHVSDKVFESGPGTFISVDSETSHGFIAKTDGKILVTFQPGGYENFFIDWDKLGLQPGPELGKLEESYGLTRPAP